HHHQNSRMRPTSRRTQNTTARLLRPADEKNAARTGRRSKTHGSQKTLPRRGVDPAHAQIAIQAVGWRREACEPRLSTSAYGRLEGGCPTEVNRGRQGAFCASVTRPRARLPAPPHSWLS